jgi:hypothetical protein
VYCWWSSCADTRPLAGGGEGAGLRQGTHNLLLRMLATDKHFIKKKNVSLPPPPPPPPRELTKPYSSHLCHSKVPKNNFEFYVSRATVFPKDWNQEVDY